MNNNYPETTELDKIKAVKEDSQIIGEFLEWCEAKQYKVVCDEYRNGTYYYEVGSIEQILAEYFDIDLKKVSAEKDAVYEWMKNES